MTANLNAVSMLFGSYAWIAGDKGTLLASGDGGATWKKINAPTAQDLRGVIMFSNDDGAEFYAVGTGGAIVHGHGVTDSVFSVYTLPSGHDVNAVWGTAPWSVYAAVANPSIDSPPVDSIIHAVGPKSWMVEVLFPGAVLHGVGGTGGDNIYVVGEFNVGPMPGIFLHKSGAGWKEHLNQPRRLRGAWAWGQEVYLVGDGGTILYRPPL